MRHPLRGGIMHRAGARIRLAGKSLKTLRRSIFFTRPLMAHQRNALLESRAFFLCPAFEKAASGAPSGTKTARPAGQRPGRFQQSCGLLESARVPVEPGWRNGGSAPSPSGRDHASRERSHSPRGEVAKGFSSFPAGKCLSPAAGRRDPQGQGGLALGWVAVNDGQFPQGDVRIPEPAHWFHHHILQGDELQFRLIFRQSFHTPFVTPR